MVLVDFLFACLFFSPSYHSHRFISLVMARSSRYGEARGETLGSQKAMVIDGKKIVPPVQQQWLFVCSLASFSSNARELFISDKVTVLNYKKGNRT